MAMGGGGRSGARDSESKRLERFTSSMAAAMVTQTAEVARTPARRRCEGERRRLRLSETHNLMKETIKDQYEVVKARTSNSNNFNEGSHVMEYGDMTFKDENLFLYQGFDPSNANITNRLLWPGPKAAVNQRDADLLFMWKRYEQLNGGSEEKLRVLREIKETVVHRKHLDSSIDFIGKLVFGFENGPSMLGAARSSGQPLVEDWDCLKRMVQIFESQCGSLTQYGMKYMRAFANICNNGVSEAKMSEASIIACSSYDSARWSPMTRGHSA